MAQNKNPIDPESSSHDLDDLPIDMDAVAHAEAVVAALSEEYLGWLGSDLDEIDILISEAAKSPAAVEKLRRKAHDIRGQGGSFGYPLITEAADGLHRIVDRKSDTLTDGQIALARDILEAMRFIVAHRASGEGEGVSRQVVLSVAARVGAAVSET